MASESEAVAEILSEMRIFKCRNLASGELERCVITQHYFADRIEAANRREVSKLKDAVARLTEEQNVDVQCQKNIALENDVAELRRRLKVAEDALEKLQDRLVSSVHDGTIDPHEALEIAENALAEIRDGSSSKRNCDRFDDFSTAKHAWHEECFDYDESSGEWVNPKFPNLTFEEWLFAPCEEGGES